MCNLVRHIDSVRHLIRDSAPMDKHGRASSLMRSAAAALLLFALVSGAGATRALADASGSSDTRQTPSPDDSKHDAMIESMQGVISWTGAVSEEEFKAMHTLNNDSIPPLHGQPVQVAGALGYLSLPERAEPGMPGIVVIHEFWGLNDHIRHWSDRLAALGYAALAVDLYGGKVATTPDSAVAFMKRVNADDAVKILLAADKFLRDDSRVKAPRTASIGWCFGGGYSLRLAIADPDLDACVMYYGFPITDEKQLKQIKCPLLGIFGTQDKSITPDMVAQFDQALTKAGVKHEIVSYDAAHAFANPSGPSYNQKAATLAWNRVQPFLQEYLKPKE